MPFRLQPFDFVVVIISATNDGCGGKPDAPNAGAPQDSPPRDPIAVQPLPVIQFLLSHFYPSSRAAHSQRAHQQTPEEGTRIRSLLTARMHVNEWRNPLDGSETLSDVQIVIHGGHIMSARPTVRSVSFRTVVKNYSKV
jgi:hypothetical protein